QTIQVEAGKYYLLVRYGAQPDAYLYFEGDTLVVRDATKPTNIILQKTLGEGYFTKLITPAEFEKAQFIPHPELIFREKTRRTAIGWYDYYQWRESILTWDIDDSLRPTASEQTTANPGMKFFTLHFSIASDEFSLKDYHFQLSDYKIQDKNHHGYDPLGGSVDAGQTYFKGELKPGTKVGLTLYDLRSRTTKSYFLSSIFFELPAEADGLTFYYQNQSLLIPQVLLKVSPEIMQIVDSWHDEFVFLVRQDENIRNYKEIKSKAIHIWWTGKEDAEKLSKFLDTIGRNTKLPISGHNVWEDWTAVLQQTNLMIFIDAETSGRLMDDYKVKQVRFYCPAMP
ncbi:hypothetical protein L0128_19695, partial [candidate division KSB1 bacterium]|nr:hypothetical protein [candidate division KSB1 bacterium]